MALGCCWSVRGQEYSEHCHTSWASYDCPTAGAAARLFDGVSRKRCPAARYGVLGPPGQLQSTLHSARADHSLSAGLKGWSVNGPKTSKGRLERAGYPIHLNAKPGGHRLSILEPRAAKGCKPHARRREAA